MDETKEYYNKLAEMEERNNDNLRSCDITGSCWRDMVLKLNRGEPTENDLKRLHKDS